MTRRRVKKTRWSVAVERIDAAWRRDVLVRYARKRRDGDPMFCAPSRKDKTSQGKPIFDTVEAATAAARELERYGAKPLEAYLCSRSRHGHQHLRTTRE